MGIMIIYHGYNRHHNPMHDAHQTVSARYTRQSVVLPEDGHGLLQRPFPGAQGPVPSGSCSGISFPNPALWPGATQVHAERGVFVHWKKLFTNAVT